MRLAIVKLSALGDIVHAMIVLQLIKKYDKEILIDWVVDENFKELLDFHPQINQVHTVNLREAKKKKSIFLLIKELKKLKKLEYYDLVIDMQGLLKSALIARLMPSKYTIGFDKFSIRESIASSLYNKTFNCQYDTNIIHRNIRLIEFSLGVNFNKQEIEEKNPYLYPRKLNLNEMLSKSKKNILLIPGASHKSKRYSSIKLADFSKLINENIIVVWGTSEEKILANQIKEISPKTKICKKLSICSLISLISEVDLVIGSDTGPSHIAWALNIPSIILFGPTPGYRNTYQTSINRIIESDSIVNPLKINKDDFSINSIEVEKILEISLELLKS